MSASGHLAQLPMLAAMRSCAPASPCCSTWSRT
jgi:hypothetical protein